jgi:hypothetical protein
MCGDKKKTTTVTVPAKETTKPFSFSLSSTPITTQLATTTATTALPAAEPKPFSFTLSKPVDTTTATIPPPKAAEPSVASSGFSFSFNKPPADSNSNATDSKPAPFSFNLPTATPSSSLSTGFSFSTTTTSEKKDAPAPFSFSNSSLSQPSAFSASTAGGFSFNSSQSFAFPGASSTTEANKGGDEEGEGDEDAGEPILEPEKILKNENDTDEILLEVPCKLLGFNKDEKEWKDSGKGNLRITKDPATQKKRILVRNTMGKITLNTSFYKDMKIDSVKGGIKFFAVVANPSDAQKTELKAFMLKLKDGDIQHVKSFLENVIKSL